MKVNDVPRDLSIMNNTNNTAESLQNRKVGPEQENNEVVPETQGKGEEVKFSAASIEFSRAAEMMDRESPERAERIKEIEKQVQEGTYEVDAAKIADKMLRDVLSE